MSNEAPSVLRHIAPRRGDAVATRSHSGSMALTGDVFSKKPEDCAFEEEELDDWCYFNNDDRHRFPSAAMVPYH